jgi:MEDS: MEthanogen/methylotroph, DcmR Sensory domain/Putative zinc-finger
MVMEISCHDLWREVSNYIDDDVDPELRARIERHLKNCRHCSAIVDGASNTVRLLADDDAFDLPTGFSQRLKKKITGRATRSSATTIPLGITEDDIPVGSHVVYFWETPEEFERGLRFLHKGLDGTDYCVIFGHDEANCRVLQMLRDSGVNVEDAVRSGRLTILARELPAQETLASIATAFDRARRRGATLIRYLGNLGSGGKALPGQGENDVLELEARVTGFARAFPCVMLCMYEAQALSARLMSKGGIETHPWICDHALHSNPKYVPEAAFLSSLQSGA